MSERSDAPHLQAIPGGDGAAAAAAAAVEPDATNGLTPPRKRGGRGRFLSDVIVELGFVPEERVQTAVEEAKSSGRTPEQVLLQSGTLNAEQLARATAERFGLDHVDLSIYKPDLGALNLIDAQAARRYNAVPIGFDDGTLLVAMADPSNVLALDDLKLLTGHELRPVVASAEDVARLISRMNRLDDAIAEAVSEDDSEDLALVSDIRASADDAPVRTLVN